MYNVEIYDSKDKLVYKKVWDVMEDGNHFYKSLRAGDIETVNKIIKEFFVPFVNLRSKKQGYAVSLIKAGCQLIGKSAGDVRSPLVMPTPNEMKELQILIDKENALIN